MIRQLISWSIEYAGPSIVGWRIYASRDENLKGELVKTAGRDERSAVVEFEEEGTWHILVMGYTKGGVEEPTGWVRKAKVDVTGRDGPAPNEPEDPAAGSVDPQLSAAVVIDPPSRGEPRHFLQVIDGETALPTYGKLVAESDVHPQSVMHESGRAQPVMIPQGGLIPPPSASTYHNPNRVLHVRNVNPHGKAGAAVERDQLIAERHGFNAIQIAQVDTTGGTNTGFPTPASSDVFEWDTGVGFRLKQLPVAGNSAWQNYGTIDSAAFDDVRFLSPFFTEGYVETDEKDLGYSAVFILECTDRAHRDAAASYDPWTSTPVNALRMPAVPAVVNIDDRAQNPTVYSSKYLMREVTTAGVPARPLRFVRWEYRVAPSSDMEGAGVPWVPYTPGMWLEGRYVQARIRLFDETGWFQVATGDIEVRARLPERVIHGSVEWVASTAFPGVAVVLPVNPITGGALFPNYMRVVATAQGNPPGGVAHIVTVSGQAAGAAGFNVMVWDAAGASSATGDFVDYIVAGY